MAEAADLELTRFAMDEQSRGKDTAHAHFFMKARQDNAATAREGRPIFKEVPYVEIMIPGDRENTVCRPVREIDKSRFAAQWNAFANERDQAISGTPLEAWPLLSRAQVEELKFFHIRTVEDLADLSDGKALRFAGVQALKAKAQSFLEAAEGMAHQSNLEEIIERQREEITALNATLRDLGSEVRSLMQKGSISKEEKERLAASFDEAAKTVSGPDPDDEDR